MDLERDSRFDAMIMSTCANCGTTWIKERVGQRHDCPEGSDVLGSTIRDQEQEQSTESEHPA